MTQGESKRLNVVVGPQRTASTFLHSLLASGNSFHVPLVKELNFLLSRSNWAEHFASWSSDEFLKKFLLNFGDHDSVLRNLTQYNRLRINQLRNFNFTKDAYSKVFQTPFPGFDISPSYCAIDESSWIQIREEFALNIFVTIRDPIERCWSALNLYARPLKKVMPDGFMRKGILENYAEISALKLRLSKFSQEVIFCQYQDLVPKLMRVFGNSVTLLDYDELISNPLDVLAQLRKVNGIVAPDRMERFRGNSMALSSKLSESAKNSLSINEAPGWFRDWHSESFPGEIQYFQKNKEAVKIRNYSNSGA